MLQFLEKGDRGRGEGNDKSSLSLLFLFSSVFFFGGGGVYGKLRWIGYGIATVYDVLLSR